MQFCNTNLTVSDQLLKNIFYCAISNSEKKMLKMFYLFLYMG